MIHFFMGPVMAGALAASPAVADEAQDKKPGEKPQVFAKAEPVAEGELAKITGREGASQINAADQNNAVEGNSVGDNSNTGSVTLSGHAFRDMNGFTMVNANTGNNVAINASIQVNIALPSD